MIHADNSNDKVLQDTIVANKLKNEEYKIWKKVVPSLYQHITTFKPIFRDWTPEQIESLPKCITFTNKINGEDNHNGIITTSVFYSLGSEIFEFDCNLPVGAYYTGDNPHDMPTPHYNEHEISLIVEETQYDAKWVWPNEVIVKLIALSEDKFVTLSKNGSVGLFQDGSKSPIETIMEDSMEDNNLIVDIDISQDKTLLVKSKSDLISKQSSIEIREQGSLSGSTKVSMNVNNMVIKQIGFLDNNKIIGISQDNRIRIWRIASQEEKEGDEPNWILQLDDTVKCSSMGSSPFIEPLFAVGFENGEIMFYDSRHIQACEGNVSSRNHHLFKLIQIDNDPVDRIVFSEVSPYRVITMGHSGNIYHWDLEYIFNKAQDEDFEAMKSSNGGGDVVSQTNIQRECLAFFHTGGARRRTINEGQGTSTMGYHPLIDDLATTVDQDGLLSVYKPCLGKYIADEEATD